MIDSISTTPVLTVSLTLNALGLVFGLVWFGRYRRSRREQPPRGGNL